MYFDGSSLEVEILDAYTYQIKGLGTPFNYTIPEIYRA